MLNPEDLVGQRFSKKTVSEKTPFKLHGQVGKYPENMRRRPSRCGEGEQLRVIRLSICDLATGAEEI